MTMRVPLLVSLVAACSTLFPVASPAAREVNVYSAREEKLIKPLLDRFTEATGIEVNLVTGEADALLARLRNEGANSPADLFITVDVGRLHRAKEAGVTQGSDAAPLIRLVPETYRDPEGHWFGLSLRARPIMYARDRVDPADLSTYEALAEDRWEGRVCIRSSSHVYNQSLVASLIAANGAERTERWAKDFVDNFARDPQGGDRDQIKAVAAGVCDIAIANTYYLAGMLTSKAEADREPAEKVAVFWPNQDGRGAHVNVSGIALTRAAKNGDNAVRLIEFLLTPESQQWYAETNGEYPVRDGIEPSPVLRAWGDFKADQASLASFGPLNPEAVRLMDRAGWK